MKTSILNTILTVTIIVLFASCSSDDGGNTVIAASCSDGIQNGNETGVDCGGSACEPCISGLSNILIGDVTTDVILDSTVAYELTGGYVIQSGGSLTIPAGTVITASVTSCPR